MPRNEEPEDSSSRISNISHGSVRQIRIVPSSDFEARRRPSLEKAIQPTTSVWPSSVLICCPAFPSHKRMVLSSELEASTRPSGDQATLTTESSCPSSVFIY